VEAKNSFENLIYSIRNTLKDTNYKDKFTEAEK